MPTYVSLVKFTQQGLMSMKGKGVSRSDAVTRNIESLGGGSCWMPITAWVNTMWSRFWSFPTIVQR